MATDPDPLGFRFDTTYARLPERLFSHAAPTPVRRPEAVLVNPGLAAELGLDPEALARPEAAEVFAGNRLPVGATPLAQAYSGHQFGHFTRLGDGRAILIGEHVAPGGRRVDVQLKGSGRTPYSRGGDGRAALGPMLREHIVGEALHALGLPTSRSLAVVATGETVYREEPLPGAVLTRVAASHLRVGTFEHAAALGDPEMLRALADYTVARHFPAATETANPYRALLDEVIERQASLVAHWLGIGFVHGVMNTDNMALSGESLDFGPCAFLDAYDPETVFSSIDHHGRYAFGRQPRIAHWNLGRFAEALLPLLDPEPSAALAQAQEAIDAFPTRFELHWLAEMRTKLGLANEEAEDHALAETLLATMHAQRADFTNTFRALADGTLLTDPAFADWHTAWQGRLTRQPGTAEDTRARQRAANPAVIPRNHKVEEALEAAWREGNLAPLHRLLEALRDPYDHGRERADYQEPAPASAARYRTFCGT
jgi:serine/tyrosine/threonine adenylyltransferase